MQSYYIDRENDIHGFPFDLEQSTIEGNKQSYIDTSPFQVCSVSVRLFLTFQP